MTTPLPLPRVRLVTDYARRLAALAWLASCVLSADPPPAYKETVISPTHPGAGPVIKLEGRFGSKYRAFEVEDNTTFDLTEMVFFARPTHPTAWKFVAGDQPKPPHNLRFIGGVFHGMIPLEWTWSTTHAFSGAALLTVGSGRHLVEYARIHNVQDGWRPRETQPSLRRAYPNNGAFLMRHCYVTGIRDDAIENDEFMPGAVEDSLFDGIHTFLSEQNERVQGVRHLVQPTIGVDEEKHIHVTRVLVRLAVTNAGDPGPGTWFKFHAYQAPRHHLVVTDSVFAAGQKPRNGWKLLNFPKELTFKGTNYLLWLGEPGTYEATVPKEVTFLEGQAARDKWHALRNAWLVQHGYEARGPEDWDPMQAPVEPPKLKVATAVR